MHAVELKYLGRRGGAVMRVQFSLWNADCSGCGGVTVEAVHSRPAT